MAVRGIFFNELASQDGKRRRVDPSGNPLPKRTCNSTIPNEKAYYEHHRNIIDAQVLQSSHKITKGSQRWSCYKCFGFSDPRYSTLATWLQSTCSPRKPTWLHESHAYRYVEPFHLCRRCGAHWRELGRSRVQKLRHECRLPYQLNWLETQGIREA